ncbi:hypothetical protein A3Q56_07546 [Intoshia linei]|uniref:Uncharacterized protein n=1 Tax=Intoshia linei TaxID=1819745 RepID=A0A177ATN4_9BILA|nr:hypothetical protein A3Q56_07546 [Intoshia linei]
MWRGGNNRINTISHSYGQAIAELKTQSEKNEVIILKFLIDTNSTVKIFNITQKNKIFPLTPVVPCPIKLTNHDGSLITTYGKFNIKLKGITLSFLITNGCNLIEKESSCQLGLIKFCYNVSEKPEKINNILIKTPPTFHPIINKFIKIFSDKPGLCNHRSHSINLKPNSENFTAPFYLHYWQILINEKDRAKTAFA